MKAFGTAMVALGAFLGLTFAPLVWIVRDGLGPKARETAGLAAVIAFFRSFFQLYVGWVVVGLLLLGVCLTILSARKPAPRVER